MQIIHGPPTAEMGVFFWGRPMRNRRACAGALGRSATSGGPGTFSLSPAMASAVALVSVLGLLLVSALPAVLGDRSSPDLRAYPGTNEGCWREAGNAHESQVPAQLTLLCPPPQGTLPRSALGRRNPGGGHRPRPNTSGRRPGRCLWGRCTPRLSWLLCCTSVCRYGKTRGVDAPGLNFPWGHYGTENRRHLPVSL